MATQQLQSDALPSNASPRSDHRYASHPEYRYFIAKNGWQAEVV